MRFLCAVLLATSVGSVLAEAQLPLPASSSHIKRSVGHVGQTAATPLQKRPRVLRYSLNFKKLTTHPKVRVTHHHTAWDKIQDDFRLKTSDVPRPLVQGWDNRIVGRYIPSALSATGMPTRLKTTTGQSALSLQAAILIALRNNPNVLFAQMNRILDKYTNERDLRELGVQWDRTLALKLNSNWQKGAGVSTTDNSGLVPSLTLTNKLGTQMSMDYAVDSRQASVTLSQDLLQGFNMHQYLVQNQLDTIQQARWGYHDSISDTIQKVIQSYVGLISAKQQYMSNLENYQSTKKTFKTTKILYRIGEKSENEFDQIKSQMVTQAFDLENYKKTLDDAYTSMATSMGLAENAKFKIPSEFDLKKIPMALPSIRTSIQFSLKHNIPYLKNTMILHQAQEGVVKARDKLQWQLKATLIHNQGVGTTTLNPDTASLALVVPLDTTDLREALFKARQDYEQQKMTFRDQKSQLVNSIITDYQQVQRDKAQLKSSELALKLNRRVLAGDMIRFKNGNITPNDMEQNRQNYISSEANFTNAKTSLFQDIQAIHIQMGDDLNVWNIKLRY